MSENTKKEYKTYDVNLTQKKKEKRYYKISIISCLSLLTQINMYVDDREFRKLLIFKLNLHFITK